MNTTAQDFLNHINAGLSLVGKNEENEPEWVGKDHNWTAYEWLVDGVSPFAVHDYLVARS